MSYIQALQTIFLCLFTPFKSKFNIDDFIAKDNYELGFKDFYNSYLKNKITEIEKLRLFNLNIIRTVLILFIIIALVTLKINAAAKNFPHFLALLFFILFFISNQLTTNFQKIYSTFVVNNIFKYFGNNFDYKETSANFSNDYKNFMNLPQFDPKLSKGFAIVNANHQNVTIRFQEILLKNLKTYEAFNINRSAPKKYKQKIINVTQGLALHLKFDTKFPSHLILFKKILGDNSLNNPDSNQFEKMTSQNADFSKNFHIFTSNKDEAEKILSSNFCEKFNQIALAFNYKKMLSALNDQQLLIYFETKQKIFNPSALHQSINLVKESQKIIQNFAAIFNFIDDILVKNT